MKHCDALQSCSSKGRTRILRLHGKCDGAKSNSEGIVEDMECKCYSSFAIIYQQSYTTYRALSAFIVLGPVSWLGLSGWGLIDVSALAAADRRLEEVAIADADFSQMWGVVGFEPQYLRIRLRKSGSCGILLEEEVGSLCCCCCCRFFKVEGNCTDKNARFLAVVPVGTKAEFLLHVIDRVLTR